MKSMPVSRGSPAMDAQKALSEGCDERSAIDAVAKSTTSHPARVISIAVARDADEVQWVWKWTGSSVISRITAMSGAAACGLSRPAMSLM